MCGASLLQNPGYSAHLAPPVAPISPAAIPYMCAPHASRRRQVGTISSLRGLLSSNGRPGALPGVTLAKPLCAPVQCLGRGSLEGYEAGQETDSTGLMGEDAAVFEVSKQSWASWGTFFALLSSVMGLLYVAWIQPSTGVAANFLHTVEDVSRDSSVTMVLILAVFALAHSGLAFLRPYGEDLIGARAYRVIFALVSLPLATLAVVYFINHRYDGVPLWNLRAVSGVHQLVWLVNFVSFFFLYPSTFNLLEVAAVDKPQLHLYETGVMRITRHPQMFGQGLWCAAHMLWIGSSFMAATSGALMAHHLFGCWHGDFRLKRKHGEAFEAVKARTSIVPFQAMLEGRQVLPNDYWREFARLPYATILVLTLGAYFAHPAMQSASHWLGW